MEDALVEGRPRFVLAEAPRYSLPRSVGFGQNYRTLQKKSETIFDPWLTKHGWLWKKGLTLVKCCRFVTVTRQSLVKNKPPIRQEAPSNEPTPVALAQKTLLLFLKFESSLPPHSLTFKKI